MITEMIEAGVAATKAMFGQAPRVYGLSPSDFTQFCGEQSLQPVNGAVSWNGLVVRSRETSRDPMHQSREWNRVKGDATEAREVAGVPEGVQSEN